MLDIPREHQGCVLGCFSPSLYPFQMTSLSSLALNTICITPCSPNPQSQLSYLTSLYLNSNEHLKGRIGLPVAPWPFLTVPPPHAHLPFSVRSCTTGPGTQAKKIQHAPMISPWSLCPPHSPSPHLITVLSKPSPMSLLLSSLLHLTQVSSSPGLKSYRALNCHLCPSLSRPLLSLQLASASILLLPTAFHESSQDPFLT